MLAIIKIFSSSNDPQSKKFKDDILDRRASLYNRIF
jgi:hypothetical protein